MTNAKNSLQALIYCRVSSERQVNEGSGIESQEHRCRNRAKEKGWSVAQVFTDEGVSGGIFDRPAIKKLIEFIDNHTTDQFVLVFDDLSRFARGMMVHLQLKAEFESRGVKLECLNFDFDGSEESEYAELILAAGNQYQRKQNRRQVIQKMKARIETGHWPFCLPPGLINIQHPIHGKFAVPQEPIASIFKAAIEGYRDRRLLTQCDVVNFINDQYKIQNINNKIVLHGVQRLLTEITYTGYVEYPHWNISRRKAVHDGFISIETYDEVQRILADRTKPRVRHDTNPDFPLRGLVLCSLCGKPFTASWNTSRNGQQYPNYFCKTADCKLRYKIIHKDKIEPDFLTFIKHSTKNKSVGNLAIEVLTDVWNQHQVQYADEQTSQHTRLQELTDSITSLTTRIAKTTDELLISSYEQEIRKLAGEKQKYESVCFPTKYSTEQFGTATRKVMEVLENPVGMWQSGNLDDQLTVFFMHFDQKPTYDKEFGFGTAQLGQSVSLIRSLSESGTSSVEMPGIEPGSGKANCKRLQA